MKQFKFFTYLILGALAFVGVNVLAQEAVDPAPLVPLPAEGPSFIVELASKYSFFVSFLAFIGSMRLLFKPIFSLARAVASVTKTPKDNELLDKAERSKIYKAVAFGLDYLASIKLPAKK